MQEPVVFASQGQKIFGMIHTPEARGPAPGVVMLHGFTGNKIEAHFLFVKAARALEEAGVAALRFDFRGSGESEGAFRDMTFSGELADAAAALGVLAADKRVDAGRLGVLGLSLGGALTACLAGQDARVHSVALWSAVSRPADLWENPRRQAWAKLLRRHGHLDIGGFDLGAGFLEDLARHDPLEALRRSQAAALIVHGSADTSVDVSSAYLYEQAAAGRAAPVEKRILKDADHTFSTLAWERQVIAWTTDWFRKTLQP